MQTLTLAPPRRRATRWSVLLPVAALHVGALWMLATPWRHAEPPPPPRIPLTLRSPPRDIVAAPRTARAPAAPAAPTLPTVPLIAPPTWLEQLEPAVERAAPPAAELGRATAQPPRAELRLALPPAPQASGPLRGSARLSLPPPNPAVADARSNTHRPNLSERFAAALGTDETPHEESFSDGATGNAVRVRKGLSCTEHYQQRSEVLDPFNANIRAMPRSSKSCK